jgi:hypothetical protein
MAMDGVRRRVIHDWLSFDQINVLPQPRKTFPKERIEELGDDIALNGLIYRPAVYCCSVEQTLCYLSVFNEVRVKELSRSLTLDDMRQVTLPDGRIVVFILLAGECRIRAMKRNWFGGCSACKKEHNQEAPGVCYARHQEEDAPEGYYFPAQIYVNISPEEALNIQYAENNHQAVPICEEALSYAEYYRVLKSLAGMSVAAFARRMGRSEEKMRHALAFSELPERIRQAAEVQEVAYGIAVELARLQSDGLGEEDLLRWLAKAVAERLKVPAFEKMVRLHLACKNTGGDQMLDLMLDPEYQMREEWKSIKAAFRRNTLGGIWSLFTYFKSMISLFKTHGESAKQSPFMKAETARAFIKLLDVLDDLLPHLDGLIEIVDRERAIVLLPAVRTRLEILITSDEAASHQAVLSAVR